MFLAYSLAFSHPYMWYVCGLGVSEVNLLKLDPLHQKITQHYKKIIADPGLVIGPDTTSAIETFDSKPWHNKNIFKVMQEWVSKIPYLREIFIAFMKGCLMIWIRFTSEFKAGEMIDGLTAEEREAAWMPATNDVNKGALGTLWIMIRRKPCLMLHQFNARFMFNQNETQEWMDKELTKEDHAYICQMAQDLDKSRPELKWKSEQVNRDFQSRARKLIVLILTKADVNVLKTNSRSWFLNNQLVDYFERSCDIWNVICRSPEVWQICDNVLQRNLPPFLLSLSRRVASSSTWPSCQSTAKHPRLIMEQ